jgi:hypothetical protein
MGMVGPHLRLAAAAAVAVLASSAPALGAAPAKAPQLHVDLTIAAVGTRQSTPQTCQAGTRRPAKTGTRSTLIGDAHKLAVVACEQPPKSGPVLDDPLAHAVSGALATLG